MNSEQWAVKNHKNEKWGSIKRLVINPATRRIVFADVALLRAGGLVRVPWENFEIDSGDIFLRVPENQVCGSLSHLPDGRAPSL